MSAVNFCFSSCQAQLSLLEWYSSTGILRAVFVQAVFSPTSCQTGGTKHVGTRRVLRLRLSRSDGSWVWNSERLQQQALRQRACEVHRQRNIFYYVENYRWSSAYEQFALRNAPHILSNRDWHPIQRTCKLMNDIYWIYCRSRITITAPNIWLPGPLVRLFLCSSSLHFLYCTDLFLILSVLHLHLATLRSFFVSSSRLANVTSTYERLDTTINTISYQRI
jgi:hypothetical protein